jgi:hypothetical protein
MANERKCARRTFPKPPKPERARMRCRKGVAVSSTPILMSLSLVKARITTRKSVTSVCFTATVTEGGTKLGRVSGAGDGSELVYDPPDLERKFAAVTSGDAAGAVLTMLQRYEDARDFRRRSKHRVLFVRAGVLRQTKRLTSPEAIAARAVELEEKHPGAVLNLMPVEAAVELFRTMCPIPVPPR